MKIKYSTEQIWEDELLDKNIKNENNYIELKNQPFKWRLCNGFEILLNYRVVLDGIMTYVFLNHLRQQHCRKMKILDYPK